MIQIEQNIPKATIALGENIKFGYKPDDIRQRHDHLSIWSKDVVLAALDDHYRNGTECIVFSEGFTAGEEFPSGGEAMATYAKKASRMHFGRELPDDSIIIEEESKDTSTQAEYLKNMSDEGKFSIDSVVAASYHLKRTEGVFDAFKAGVERYVSAEDSIAENASEKLKRLRKRQSSRNFGLSELFDPEKRRNIKKDRYIAEKVEKVKETILNVERFFDPKQLRLRALTHKSRN